MHNFPDLKFSSPFFSDSDVTLMGLTSSHLVSPALLLSSLEGESVPLNLTCSTCLHFIGAQSSLVE